jgi:membrane protease YdiL (CAAX protease family)
MEEQEIPEVEYIPVVEIADPPPRLPGFGYWKAVGWAVVFLIITQIVGGIIGTIGGVVVAMLQGKEIALGPVMDDSILFGLIFSQWLGIGFSYFLIRRKFGKSWIGDIKFQLPYLEHVILTVLAMPALFVFSHSLEQVVTRIIPSLADILNSLGIEFGGIEEFMNSTKYWNPALAVLAIGVGPALGEELFCRAFLGENLRRRKGVLASVLFTSFIFGAIHIEPQQATMAAMLAIPIHLSYLASGSLWIPILIHFLNNALAILAINDTFPVPVIPSITEAVDRDPAILILFALFLFTAILLAFRRTSRLDRLTHYEGFGRAPRPLDELHLQDLLLVTGSIFLFSIAWLKC